MDRPPPRRTLTHALAGAALLLTTLAAAPPSGGAAQAVAAGPGCAPGNAQARVVKGRQGVDPNTVTAGEARRMDAGLRARVDRLVEQGVLRPNGSLAKARRITVPVHVHVITSTTGAGQVGRKQVKAQIRVLNDAYAGRTSPAAATTPFRFKLVSTDVTINDDWYFWQVGSKHESKSAVAAKRALHRGGWGDLNLYIANLSGGLLGYALMPGHTKLAVDGVVLLNESLPGGDAAPYNEGDTATHEVGHWLGLFHTFQNGCKAPGDHVADTPYQAAGPNIFFCRKSDDTCKQPGTDPVHNFMSYGDDPCLNQFTRGQSRRMVEAWAAYRR